jgi:hypothetical protein
MGRSICQRVLLGGACVVASCMAWGQQTGPEKQEPARFEVGFTYDSVLANLTTGNEFWMQGGSMQIQARLWHGLGVVADVGGLHTASVNDSGTGLDLITTTFGPRYTWSPLPRRFAFFGQVLAGEAHGMNSMFPSGAVFDSSGNSLALQIGGGINLPLTRHFSARALEANWLRTQLSNATTNVQNNLCLGAGIVYQLK